MGNMIILLCRMARIRAANFRSCARVPLQDNETIHKLSSVRYLPPAYQPFFDRWQLLSSWRCLVVLHLFFFSFLFLSPSLFHFFPRQTTESQRVSFLPLSAANERRVSQRCSQLLSKFNKIGRLRFSLSRAGERND